MDVFCDRLKLGSIAALDCQTGQNKGRYHEKELLFLLVSLASTINWLFWSVCRVFYPFIVIFLTLFHFSFQVCKIYQLAICWNEGNPIIFIGNRKNLQFTGFQMDSQGIHVRNSSFQYIEELFYSNFRYSEKATKMSHLVLMLLKLISKTGCRFFFRIL